MHLIEMGIHIPVLATAKQILEGSRSWRGGGDGERGTRGLG